MPIPSDELYLSDELGQPRACLGKHSSLCVTGDSVKTTKAVKDVFPDESDRNAQRVVWQDPSPRCN